MNTILVAHMNALPGRESEFDEWYTYVHIRDVMRMRGAVAVQRFSARDSAGYAPPDYRFLTIYEVADPSALSKAHSDAAGTSSLVLSPAADLGRTSVYYYQFLLQEERARAAPPSTGTILVDYPVAPFDIAAMRRRVATRFDQGCGESAWLVKVLPYAQMFRRPTEYPYLALYSFPGDLDADQVNASAAGGSGRWRSATYVARTERLTRDHVADADRHGARRENDVRRRAVEAGPARWGSSR